jgi:hypothetical protein
MSEQVEPKFSSSTLASNLWLGATSAFRALALVAIFDREYRFAPWLHWLVVNWNAFLGNAFSFLRLDILPQNRTLLAFGMIMWGTIIAEQSLKFFKGRHEESRPPLGLVLMFSGLPLTLFVGATTGVGFSAFVFYFNVAFCMFSAFMLGTRTLLWLLAFVVVFVGLNELALAVGGTIPAPPSS